MPEYRVVRDMTIWRVIEVGQYSSHWVRYPADSKIGPTFRRWMSEKAAQAWIYKQMAATAGGEKHV